MSELSAAPWARAVYVLWAVVAVTYSAWAARMVWLARSSRNGTRETLLHLEAWSAVGFGGLLAALTAAALGLLVYRAWLATRQPKRDTAHTAPAAEAPADAAPPPRKYASAAPE